MGKKPKRLSREEFSAIGTPEAGAIDQVEQKEAMTREDLAAIGAAPGDRLAFDPGMAAPLHGDSKYGVGHLQLQGDFNKHLATNQGWVDEMGNAGARIALDLVPGILGSIGGMADVPDWFAGVNDQNEEVGNSLTRWANQTKQHVNEEMFPIYQKDQTPGVHLGSSEWWFDKGASVIESAAEFAALGYGVGSLLTKGLAAAKWLSAVDAATGGVKLNALGQSIGVGTNAFLLNQAESILDATQTYDDEYKKNLEAGQDDHTARVNAAQAAAHVVNIDRINIALNLTSVGAIMRGARGTRNIKSMMNPVQRTVLEGGQEYAEETVNFFAGQRAAEKGAAQRAGKEYTGLTFSKLIDDMTSAQGIEAGVLGALGGVAQTGVVETVNSVRGTNKGERDWIAGQQKVLADFDGLRQSKKLSNVFETTTSLEQHTALINHKKTLEAEIAADVAAGKEPDMAKVVAVRDAEHQILAAQAFNNFQRGTTDYLEKAYQDIAGLTDEQAKENGFTEDELNPKSPAYFKTKANKALEMVKRLEKEYIKAESYMNPAELFKIKAKEFGMQEHLQIAQAKLAEKGLDATNAVSNLARKTLFASGVSNIFDLKQLGESADKELDFTRRHVLGEAKKLPAVQEYEKFAENVKQLEEEVTAQQDLYTERSSKKVQDELKAKRQKEVTIKADLEKAMKVAMSQREQASEARTAEATTPTMGEAKDILNAENMQNDAFTAEVDEMIRKTVDGEDFTPQEIELLNTSPAHKEHFDNVMRRMAENQQNKKEEKVDKVAGDPQVTTDTEVAQVTEESVKFTSTTLDSTLIPTNENKDPNRLWTAHNVMAWLARLYTKHFNPTKLTGILTDVDNNLNEAMVNPDILDNRKLDVGDEVTFEVDPNGLMPVVENGEVTWKPWDGVKTNPDVVPIIIKKDGVPVAHLHLPGWITAETTQALVEDDRKALRAIRTKVLESEKPVKSKVTKRTYGKLFISADKKPLPVSEALKDETLQYGVWYKNNTFADGRTEQGVDKALIVNNKMMRSGRSYVLVPIMHANKRSGRKQTQYWAVPMMPKKLSAEIVESLALAVSIHYKAIEGTELSAEEQKLVSELKKHNPLINQDIKSFDITTPIGLKNYLSLFIYAEHSKDVHQHGQSLDDFLRTKGITTDYHAMDIGTKKEADGSLTGVGVFFGSGQVGTVNRSSLALENYINAFKDYLGKVYTHASLTYFSSDVKVPILKADGTVSVLNEGGSYLDYLKQHAWETNLTPHNISKDPAKPNYVYTIQQIIEYETAEKVESPKLKAPAKQTGDQVTKDQLANKAGQQVITEEGTTKPVTNPIAAQIISSLITPQFADPDAEVATDFDMPAFDDSKELTGEEIKTIKDRYRVPGISLKSQMSLINWITGTVNQAFAKAFEANPNVKQAADFKASMEVSRAYLAKMVEDKAPGALFAAKVLENWAAVERLTAYSLKTNFGYSTSNIKYAALTNDETAEEKKPVEDKEEQHALNTWGINTLEQDPTSSLTGRFKRFLALIQDPTKDSIIPGFNEHVNPVELYQYLSSLLADQFPNFDELVTILEEHVKSLGENAALSPLPAFITAIRNADQQIKDEFVVSMSKHYVNMQHLYIVPVYGGDGNYFMGYDTYVRNDNATAKAAVLKSEWQANLTMDRDSGLILVADDLEGNLFFNGEKAGQIADEFVNDKDFNLDTWLKKIGIKLSPQALQVLKTNGMRVNGSNLDYDDLFKANSSPFKLIAGALKSLQNRKDPVKVDNSEFVKERFWNMIAKFNAKYSDVSHSHTHRSGDVYVFSYADNKYLTDRFRDLKDVKVLTGLADRSFSKHSWWLKKMLKMKTKNGVESFERDADGNVIINTASSLVKTMELNYMSLQAMKEKGVATPGRQSLEELSVVEHERAKLLYFQNTGTVDTEKIRTAEFFLMTLSNKNTMFTVKSTVPTLTFNEDGSLSDQVIQLMFDNIVMPEIQRMWDYKDDHNINGYTEGHKLFYLFPKLNSLPIFNEDGSLRKDVTVKKDPTKASYKKDKDYRRMINDVIRETIQAEVAFKMDQWHRYGIIKGVKGKMVIDGFDRKYINYAKSQVAKGADNHTLATFAAAEMAVAYMLVNTSIFQTISMDPATYWKSKTAYDKNTQVRETFENITKRLGGEISPGRDQSQPTRGQTYNLGIIQDVDVPSKALKKLQEINARLGINNKDYANIKSTDAVEFITIPEKITFMRQSAKLNPAQSKMADEILDLYDGYMKALAAGEDTSKFDFNINQIGFMMQVDKPIMVGTRIDAAGVETKVYVKSAAFTLIPQVIRGTELEKLALMMDKSGVDRLAFASAVKLGAPRSIKKVFDEDGNFIENSLLSKGQENIQDDVFRIDRRWLRLQQEVPSKTTTEITRVSQASKLLFVDILEKNGFRLPGDDKEYTAKELKDKYHQYYEELYRNSKDKLLKELGINPNQLQNWQPDPQKLAKIVQEELIDRGYPPHDLDALAIVSEGGKARFVIEPWALAKSGKLEAFLNAIVDSRIVDQTFNGFSYIMATEAGFRFTKSTKGKKQVITDLSEITSEIKSGITFTNKFKGELQPAVKNNGYHQVIVPWKYKNLRLEDYITDGVLDFQKMDPELLKAFGMRIPNQGPNSTAAIEIVGFLPPNAGDMIIAPADFVVQMGSDFDIDKLYVYLANHKTTDDNKLSKITDRESGNKEFLQNQILDIHLSINTNMDREIQSGIVAPLESQELRDIATEIDNQEKARNTTTGVNNLAYISGSYQAQKYINSTIASTAIGAFAVQNTFNALAQYVPLELRKAPGLDKKPRWSKITFGTQVFNGQKDFNKTGTLNGKSKKSHVISALLSAAVDDEKEQILAKIGINSKNISMANLLSQAGFDLKTIAYFLKQDAIQEYCRQLVIMRGNEDAALNAVMKMEQFHLDEKKDKDFLNRGEDVTKMTNPDEIKMGNYEPTDNYESKRFWSMYNSGVNAMEDQFRLGDQARDYKYTQYALLLKFRDLQRNEVKTLRQVQSLVNTDTKGPGKNMFESLEREKALWSMLNSKLYGAEQLFGEMIPVVDTENPENSLTGEELEQLAGQGYVRTGDYMFKPKTIPGFAMAYGVITNNKLWNKYFPYSNSSVEAAFNEIADNMGEEAAEFTQKADRNRRIFRQVKNYVNTDNSVLPFSPNEVRQKLLYDTEGNESLATIWQSLKENPVVRNHKFLSNLFVVQAGDKLPKSLLFKKPQDGEWTNLDIYSQVIDSLKHPKDLGTFNGITYTTRTFIEHLFLATKMAGTSALQQELLQYMPPQYSVLIGEAAGLNNYDWKKLSNGRSPGKTVSNFTKQYFQHNPKLAPQIPGGIWTIGKILQESVSEPDFDPNFSFAEKVEIRDVVKFQLLPDAEYRIDRATTGGDLPMFLANRTSAASGYNLYMLTDLDNRIYTKIPTLGMVNNHEFNANNENQSSLIATNNAVTGESIAPPVSVKSSVIAPIFPEQGTPYTPEDQLKHEKRVAIYGLPAITDARLSKPQLKQMLLNIAKISTREDYKAVAEFLSQRVDDFDIKFTTGPTFYEGDVTKPSRGAAGWENGKLYVRINLKLLPNDESLEWTILHEMAHAVTIEALKHPQNDRQRNAKRRLTELYEKYKQVKPSKPEDLNKWDELLYPTKNIEEFVVAALTQPEFRKVINTIPYDKDFTFWDKLVEIFNKLFKSFGLEKDSTAAKALNDIMQLTDARPTVVSQVTTSKEADPVEPPEANAYFDEETGEVIDMSPATLVQMAELQKLIDKKNKQLDLSFDMPAEGETDTRPESKGTRYSKLISELRSHKAQLEKRIVEIRLSVPKANVKTKADLKRRQEAIERNIVGINEQIQNAQRVVKLEDLTVAQGPADVELDEVNLLLAQGNMLSFEDIEIINRKIKLWTDYADNFLTEYERALPGMNDIFKDVFLRATKYQEQLEAIKKQKIFALAERMTGKKLDPKTFYEAITDINTVAAYTLSLDNADHVILQSVFAYIKEAENNAQEEILEETEELKKLLDAVKGKEAITGKNLENLIAEDGTLIMPYSPDFLQKKYAHFRAAKALAAQGDKNAAKEWQLFRQFIKENEIIFDLRKLVKIAGHEAVHSKDAGKLEKMLRDTVGKAEFERKLSRAQDKYNNYLAELQNFTDSVNMDNSIADKAAAIKEWEVAHDPFQYSDYINDVQGAAGNKGYRYVETTPTAVDSKGKPTGWYDERYKALQADPDVAKLHDHIVNLLVRLRRYLPESTAREFGINSLPALQKSLVESMKSEGLAVAMGNYWNSVKKGLTSGDVGQELYGGLQADRYLSVQIDSISNKIDKAYNQKLADYMRQNMLTAKDIANIAKPVLDNFRAEATAEVKAETSMDLKSLLGIYTAAVVDYRHKSRIEDAVRLAEDVFNTHVQGYRTNAAGKAYTINEEGRKSKVIDPNGLKNYRGMLKYTLDRFFRVPREIEGKTDKKLYSKKEQKRQKALEKELKKYKEDLAKAETQLAELRNAAEGMPAAEYAEKEKTATELKDAAISRIDIVNQELEKLGRVVTGTGIADYLLKYIMIKGLGWNPFSGFNNMGFGLISNITEAAGGNYFNESQILQGYKLAMNSVAKFWSVGTVQNQVAQKIRYLMDNMHVLHKPSEELFQNSVPITGVASSLHWANIQNRTEYLNQAPVMIAMMLGHKLTKKDGSESNLWEALGKDGRWDVEAFGAMEKAFPARDRGKFHIRLQEAIRKTHGNYDPSAPIQIKGSIAGRMLSVFRTWAFEGFATRFEKYSDNQITDIKRKGRYRSYGGGSMALVGAGLGSLILGPGLGTALGTGVGIGVGKLWGNKQRFREGHEDTSMFEELFLETKYLLRKLTFGLTFKNTTLDEKFTTVDAANLRKNMTEISILMYLMGMAMVLRGLRDDEDDEEMKYVLNYQLNIMNRLTQDIGFYADPVSFQKILRDPIPATSTVEDTFKWIKAANQYLQGDDIIPTGPYAKQSRLNRATGRLVPFWKQVVTTQDLMFDERK